MDALEAALEAEWIELNVGLTEDRTRAECYPVPLRPGPTRTARRWAFLLVTDAEETAVRGVLAGLRAEVIQRRGRLLVYMLFPR